MATDLLAGKSVWFQRGPLDEAIRASIAIPGVIAPHAIDGRLLADGGILDPLPMAPIAAVNADLTIAVSLSGSETITNREPEPGATVEWLNRMVRSTSALLDTAAARSLLDSPTARAVLSRLAAAGIGVGQPGRRADRDRDDAAELPVDRTRRAEAGQLRSDEPDHRHRPGRAGPPHAGGLSARPADRGPALDLPGPGIPPGGGGDRGRPRAGVERWTPWKSRTTGCPPASR